MKSNGSNKILIGTLQTKEAAPASIQITDHAARYLNEGRGTDAQRGMERSNAARRRQRERHTPTRRSNTNEIFHPPTIPNVKFQKGFCFACRVSGSGSLWELQSALRGHRRREADQKAESSEIDTALSKRTRFQRFSTHL